MIKTLTGICIARQNRPSFEIQDVFLEFNIDLGIRRWRELTKHMPLIKLVRDDETLKPIMNIALKHSDTVEIAHAIWS